MAEAADISGVAWQPDDDDDEELCCEDCGTRVGVLSNVLNDLRDKQQVMVDPQSDDLAVKLETVELLQAAFKSEKKPATTELAYDGKAVKLISNYAHQKALSLNSSAKFDEHEFASRLRRRLTGGGDGEVCGENLNDVGQSFQKYFRQAPRWQIMFGVLPREEIAAKAPAERKRKLVDGESGRKVRPEKLDSFQGANDDEATTVEVGHVYNTLKSIYKNNPEKQLSFFEFVLDPSSFSRTVENLFHVTFLVRDNRVAIGGDEYETIRPLGKQKEDEDRSDIAKLQMYLNISHKQWQALVKKLKLSSAMIKRKPKKR